MYGIDPLNRVRERTVRACRPRGNYPGITRYERVATPGHPLTAPSMTPEMKYRCSQG